MPFSVRSQAVADSTEPEGIAFGPDGNLCISSRSEEVLRYDGQSGAFIDVFASGNGLVDPAGIAFGGPDDDLYVSSGIADDGVGGNQILRFDGVTGAFETVVDPTNAAGLDDPEGMTFGADGLLYVDSTPEEGPGEVLRYDPATNAFVDKFVSAAAAATSSDPTDLVFGPDGDLFVSSAETSEVNRYDGTTGAFEGDFVTAGLGGIDVAEGMAFSPNGNLLVASELGNAVLEYDGTTGEFVGEFVTADAAAWRSRRSSPSDPPRRSTQSLSTRPRRSPPSSCSTYSSHRSRLVVIADRHRENPVSTMIGPHPQPPPCQAESHYPLRDGGVSHL